jgi:pyruvate dehydrogenase E2 component (dihydrolipoamide acetyltransferase)
LSIENIQVPDLGDAGEVEVIELLVSVGQTVAENDSLLVLESDKAAMEIPAPVSGVVKSISVNLGDQVASGSDILSLEVEDGEAASAPETKEEPSADKEPSPKKESIQKPAQKAEKQSQKIEVPDLGTDEEVEVIEIHVKKGDSVAEGDSLITLESDKAAMDVPASLAGVIEALSIAVGDKVKTGATIATILGEVSAVPEESIEKDKPAAEVAEAPAAIPAAPVSASRAPTPPPASGGKVYAGPAVRKLARELGVDLSLVLGSGAKSRIIKEDIHEFVKSRINGAPASGPSVSAVPDIDFSQFGEIEEVPRSKLHKLTAVNMQRNWSSVPHVAQFNDADVTDLEEFRAELRAEAERKGIKLTFLPFLLKACAMALIELPQFNVSLHSSGEHVVQKKYIHIGMAVATEAGLVVPVIRDVDQKTIWQLATEVIELSEKAKSRKLKREDMQGACFTISSLGAIGGTGFIPIINAPEVAILGVAKTEIKPVYIDGAFVPRKMLPYTLSYDHRAVNGADGGQFVTLLSKLLADVRHLAL